MDTTSLTNNGLNRPKCQYVGALPHKATHILTWFLQSGIRVKFSCNSHKNMFGGPGYLISAMEGWEDNKKRPVHPIGTPEPSQAELSQADPVAPEEEQEDDWEDKQRALAAQAAAEGRPRAINQRRGF